MLTTFSSPFARSAAQRLRIGFMPLNDAAPLIVAQELGIFTRHGLDVQLCREVGWATIRDKIIYRELHAAHALVSLLVSAKLGLGCPPTDCLTACVLNLHGNAITLSEPLWQADVRDASSLQAEIARRRRERPLVLGVVFQHSSHYIQLSDWLRNGGINPRRDVRIVVVPPPQVFRNLAAGNIDGYCVGEPWTSLAVKEGAGWCAATSRDLDPGHPEKALMVRSDFAASRHDEHLALVASLLEAAALCDQADFRPELVRLLSRREYLNLPAEVISRGLTGPFHCGHGIEMPATDLVVFSHGRANDPLPAKIGPILEGFRRSGLLLPNTAVPAGFSREIFRTDLFHQTLQRQLLSSPAAHDVTHS